MGDKRSLKNVIHDITGIPVAALEKCHLSTFIMSERIAWAKNRRTTESEDSVYCLLGILGVFMPASYGEEKEEAWRRLQIEVKVANNAPSIIPFSQNVKFTEFELIIIIWKFKCYRALYERVNTVETCQITRKDATTLRRRAPRVIPKGSFMY